MHPVPAQAKEPVSRTMHGNTELLILLFHVFAGFAGIAQTGRIRIRERAYALCKREH